MPRVVKKEGEDKVGRPRRTVSDDLVLGVHIHGTDHLKTDTHIFNPVVKIHAVDDITGQYVRKEHSLRPGSSLYGQDNVDHILPLMTQPFDFKKNKSIIPEWQEQVIFNERFGYFLQQNSKSPRVILFFEFELIDIDSKLCLQLFYPPKVATTEPIIEVVEWWRKYPRKKYPSTLYVTVKGIKLPERLDPRIRPTMPVKEEEEEEEEDSTSYSELQDEVTKTGMAQPLDTKPPVLRWSRLPGQVNGIPDKPVLALHGGQMGCFTVTFSHAGTLLAAACADRDAFPVVVYEIPSGKVLFSFSGHLKIVSDLCWSRDDRRLLSASSDGTVKEWNVEKLLGRAQKLLTSSRFVYCAQYHPTAQNLVVTGGYNGLVQVWRLDVESQYGQLLQEFEGHKSFINTLCFDSEGKRMFSADNLGVIIAWKTSVNKTRFYQLCHNWCIVEKIIECDLSDVPINKLQLHPNGRSLLIHAKDSTLRKMDLISLAVKKYIGAKNYRDRIYSTFTPCGSFIFSGSEDGMAYVWNTETGDQVAVYSKLNYYTSLTGIAFHPHENMVAFCACGKKQPLYIYLYDLKVKLGITHTSKSLLSDAGRELTLKSDN
ncbi:jouberin-like [Aulostomus maculatus]